MYGSFSVGALAVKNAEGNAIGAVRMTVYLDRLEIELLKVGAFADSFVPGALTERARFDAPYTSIRGLVRRGEALVLTLDPRCPTPHTRFALTHFTDLPLEALAQAHKRRTRAIFLRRLLPLPAGALAALLTPDHLASGALGRVSVGLAAFAGTFALMHLWVRVRSWGGPFSERLSQAFETRIAERLAIVPALDTRVDEAPAELLLPVPQRAPRKPPATKPWRAPKPVAAPVPPAAPPPRPAAEPTVVARIGNAGRVVRVALAAAAIAAVGVGGFAAFRWIDDGARLRVVEARAKETADEPAASLPPPTAEPIPEPPPPPSCTCARADSPLWSTAMPALSVVLVPKQRGEDGKLLPTIAPFLTKRGASRYAFDVAVVNNAAVPLKDVRIVVTFARRNKKGERVGATDRGLFAASLGPGRSMKWSVSGPGTEYKIEITEKRVLGAAKGQLAAAPATAFVKLLGAKQSAVRLHAALMLAYLHDPGAREAAEALSDLSESDDVVRQMVLRATEPLSICDARVVDDALDACIVNAGTAATRPLEIFEVGPGGRAFPVGVGLKPGAGAKIRVEPFDARAAELGVREAPVRRGQSLDAD